MVLAFAVAIYIGTALSSFFQTAINDLVMPVVAGIFGSEKDLEKWTVQAGPFAFKVGGFLSALFNLAIAFLVVSFTLPYLSAYAPPVLGAGRK